MIGYSFLFDLNLLEKDLEDEGDSPSDHTLYYLGLTHFALIEAKIPMLSTKEEREEFANGEVSEREDKLYITCAYDDGSNGDMHRL